MIFRADRPILSGKTNFSMQTRHKLCVVQVDGSCGVVQKTLGENRQPVLQCSGCLLLIALS